MVPEDCERGRCRAAGTALVHLEYQCTQRPVDVCALCVDHSPAQVCLIKHLWPWRVAGAKCCRGLLVHIQHLRRQALTHLLLSC